MSSTPYIPGPDVSARKSTPDNKARDLCKNCGLPVVLMYNNANTSWLVHDHSQDIICDMAITKAERKLHDSLSNAVSVFQAAWHKADANKLSGHRTEAGIRALGRAGLLSDRNVPLDTTIDPGVGLTEEAISLAIGKVLFNVNNFPPGVQHVMLGRDFSELRQKLTDAVLELIPSEVEPTNGGDLPCGEWVPSWSIYKPEQIDSYDIPCTELGVHTIHKNGELGCSWEGEL